MTDVATEIVIGCDSGTRAVKAVAMTMSGELVATAIEPHRGVRMTAGGGADQDAAGLYRALERALGRAARAAGRQRLAAIALTTQRDCVVALAGRRPARPMFSWMDRRVLDRALVPRSCRGPKLAALVQHSRARWMARHQPRAFASVTQWTTLPAYFHLQLSDRRRRGRVARASSRRDRPRPPLQRTDARPGRRSTVAPRVRAHVRGSVSTAGRRRTEVEGRAPYGWCPPSGGPREVRLKPDTTTDGGAVPLPST